MNKGKCIFSIFLLVFTPLVYADTVVGISDGIELEGYDTSTIEGGSHMIYGGLKLSGNSRLTLNNTVITFANIENVEYTVSDYCRLIAINSSIIWLSPDSLQVSQNASIELTNVELYSSYEIDNGTFFSTGIGLADNSKISVRDSHIGFIRLAENAQCSVNNTILGNFGTQSSIDAEFTNCTVESILLYYEKSRVQVNQSITGKHGLLTQSQFVKAGENAFDFKMKNCTLLNPPKIIVVDGKLEARDTVLDRVYMNGDSAIETTNTRINTLITMSYCWAIIQDSQIDNFNAWRGEFNIQLTNTTHHVLDIYDSVGLNLKINGTKTEELILDWSETDRPQNVELVNMEIGNLNINMFSPTPIQCSEVTVRNLTISSWVKNMRPVTITGSINFTENAEITQIEKEGYTNINRVYLIQAFINETPATNTQLTITTNNRTKTITTNQNGEAVISINYQHHFDVIENPQPEGPYLIKKDNLTAPVIITLLDTSKTINILSDAPVTISATSQTTIQQGEPDWSQYTAAAILIALIAIAVYLVNSRRLEEANRQIQ